MGVEICGVVEMADLFELRDNAGYGVLHGCEVLSVRRYRRRLDSVIVAA